jgi:hypothetical protein
VIQRWLCAACLLVTAACEQPPAARRPSAASADTAVVCDANVRRVVERFGARLKLVSVLGHDSAVVRSLRSAYGPFVTPELLAEWQADPARAPGREVSNPWPARITIRSVRVEDGGCRVAGDVVFVAMADTASIIELRPVILHLRNLNGWRVSGYRQ